MDIFTCCFMDQMQFINLSYCQFWLVKNWGENKHGVTLSRTPGQYRRWYFTLLVLLAKCPFSKRTKRALTWRPDYPGDPPRIRANFLCSITYRCICISLYKKTNNIFLICFFLYLQGTDSLPFCTKIIRRTF